MSASTAVAVNAPGIELELELGDTAIPHGRDLTHAQDLALLSQVNAPDLDPCTTAPPASRFLFPDSSPLPSLRRRIELITSADPDPDASLATGIAGLDAALSRRGVPRGRLTEVIGARGSGKATLLRHLVNETLARGLGAVYVDASRTLAPRDWAHAASAAGDRFWIVRPMQASKGAWCADVLLRSGAFALVVLDGAPPLPHAVAVRLTRLAHDAAAAFVVVGGDHAPPTLLPGALRLRVDRARRPRQASVGLHAGNDPPPRPGVMTRWMTITVEKGGRGQRQTVEVEHAVRVAHRLCTHPEVPDRRGAARSGGSGGREGGGEGENRRRSIASQPQPEHRRIPELASVG